MDPADQWVFDPETGDYRLRQTSSAQQPTPPARRRTSTHSASGQSAGAEGGRRRAAPPQRGRRAAGGRGASAAEAGGGAPGRRRQKARTSGKKKALYWTGGVMAFVLLAGCTGGYFVYQHFNDNLQTVNPVGIGNKNGSFDGPLNILLIGTDRRSGKGNQGYGDASSVGHADTTLLFHISEDRSNATVLSIPRDMIVDIPDCPTVQPDGTKQVIPGTQQTRFNNSLGQDSRDPGCTMRTVKAVTGIEPDHFLMADFNAVKDISTAVGGVEVCLSKDLHDPKSHLDLTAGKHMVKGEQALAFVRTRHAVGNESDLDRIKLQQQFLSSMIRKIKSDGTLTDAGKLWDLANVATNALTVDTGIGSVKKLTDLAGSISDVDIKNMTFVTVPVIDNPAETVKATVVANKQPAEQLFAMIQADNSLTESKKKAKAAEDAKLKGEKADPSQVRVEVLNGGGPFGAAQGTVDWLQNTEGVLKSSNGGNATGPKQQKTTLEYAPNQADQARRLADMMGLPASALKPGTQDAEPLASMTLVLGADFKGAGIPLTAPTKAPEGLPKVNASQQVCAG
jgi:LCP family protein required for cell wall assembly